MTAGHPDGRGGREPRETEPPRAAYDLVAHLRSRATDDERVLDAILHTPREAFVEPGQQPWAYEDRPLPIGHEQTISQPTIVAVMSAALALRGDERVLEVGAGSGYQAAVLARLAREVVTVEAVPALREQADARLRSLGLEGVRVLPAGDEIGAPDLGPYDAILVAAAAPAVPPPLLAQLAPGGRLVIPVGSREAQRLLRITRGPDSGAGTTTTREDLGGCRFVPLVGPHGFGEDD